MEKDAGTAQRKKRGLSLEYRIVIPYAILVIISFGAVGVIAASSTADIVETSLHGQMEKAAQGLSQWGFMLNRDMLVKMKDLLGVEGIITMNSRFEVVESTFEPREAEGLVRELAKINSRGGDVAFEGVETAGQKWYAAVKGVKPSQGYTPAGIALLYPPDIVERAVQSALLPLVIAGLGGLIVTLAVGLIIVRSITNPIRRLVKATREVRGGCYSVEAPTGGGVEIVELGGAIAEMTAALKEYQERIVAAEKMATLGTIATSLAHEIRNPLAGIQMSVETIKSRSADSEISAECDVLLTEIKRLNFTLSELLAFARPPAMRPAEVDFAEIADETVSVLKRQFEHRGIALRIEIPEKFPKVRVDTAGVKQVLMNLLLNAMEAMPQGGNLTVSAQGGPTSWSFAVMDTGGGFEPGAEEKMYEPFYSTKPDGTGLGLAVCKTIVELHGGKIEPQRLQSATVFRVVLPLIPPAGAADADRKEGQIKG
jgi:signal transduction histidine kinase